MNTKEKNLLKTLLIAVAFYFAILRFDKVLLYIGGFLNVIKPFLLGGAIAFIINVPMVKIEKLLSKSKIKKFRRGIAFMITLFMLTGVIGGFRMIVVPQLADAIGRLIIQIQQLMQEIPRILESHSGDLTFIEEYIVGLNINWDDLSSRIVSRLQTIALGLVNSGTDVVGGLLDGFITFLLSFIFAIYILLGKEKNAAGLMRLSQAALGEKTSGRIHHVLSLSYKSFSSFLSGQCLEAVILGGLFVVAMTLFNMPYAFLIGSIIAVTALIPVFGAFIGCFVGIFLIALENPVMAAEFVVMFLVIQQIEGNVIYPKVVGNSIGLPAILVFMSVILGNNLMGVVGMLVFIPAVSVLYTLTKEYIAYKENLSTNREETVE